MPIKNDREYRLMVQELRKLEDEDQRYIVEGYATTFNDPYLLYDDGEYKLYEEVDRKAFEKTDMKDVIFQFDHQGMVYARNKNGTLELTTDDHGLKVRADLSRTQASREMYEAIAAGLVDQMSFAFKVRKDSFDKEKRLRTILDISRLYDVSAVSIPANPGTEISARSYADGVIEQLKAERLEQELAEKRAKIKILLEV